jgi:hypothetical protein
MKDDWHKEFNKHEAMRIASHGTYFNRPTKNPIVLLCAYILKIMGYRSTIIKTKAKGAFYMRCYYQD